ncbi:Protein-export membrane protein SecF [uncultured archaeon]|nr:Protein-export membrane protein SecF [uncultured archaeon]
MQNPYERFPLRYLFAITVILIVASLALIPSIQKGVDFKGGLLISAQTTGTVNTAGLEAALAPFSNQVEVRTSTTPSGTTGVEIQLGLNENLQKATDVSSQLNTDEHNWLIALSQAANPSGTPNPNAGKAEEATVRADAQQLLTLSGSTQPLPADTENAIQFAQTTFDDARNGQRSKILAAINPYVNSSSVSFREIGSSLSQYFVTQPVNALIISLILTAIIVFIALRGIIASATVMYGAIGTLIITGGAMAVLGIPLSLATIAAMLLLVGLSIDTATVLTLRVYKGSEGTPAQRAYETFPTVSLMNTTNVAAFGVLALAGFFWKISVYQDIGFVVAVGSLADLVMTWFGNAPFILWYVHRKERKRAALGF